MNDDNGHKHDAGIDAETRPAKPCCKRINHDNVCRFEASVTWCILDDGHEGQCSGTLPPIVEANHFGSRWRR